MMGCYGYAPDILPKYVIDYDNLFQIKDFLLLMKVIEHLENKILELKETTIFHLCTIVYKEEDLKRMLRKEVTHDKNILNGVDMLYIGHPISISIFRLFTISYYKF